MSLDFDNSDPRFGSPFELRQTHAYMQTPEIMPVFRKALAEAANKNHPMRRVEGRKPLDAAAMLFYRRLDASGGAITPQSMGWVPITYGRVREVMRIDPAMCE